MSKYIENTHEKSGVEIEFSKAASEPMIEFAKWYNFAEKYAQYEPNAMVLATVSQQQQVNSRMLLLKWFDDKGFVFFTNYLSKKAEEIEFNNQVSALFWWPQLRKQIRIKGRVEKISMQESDDYFASRSFESKISAIVSAQSQEIPNQTYLQEKFSQAKLMYKDINNIPRPKHWGGYCITPNTVEFWQQQEHRLHQRLEYKLKANHWHKRFLSP